MSELDPALFAEMRKRRFVLFGAVEIVLPGRTVRLVDGAAEVPIGDDVYSGRDPDWGVLDFIKGLEDSNGDNSPAPTLGLIPSGDLALASMLDPALQGSPITVMLGALDRASGLPVGAPTIPFTGELDVPTVKWGRGERRVEFRLSGIGDRLFAVEEGRRLSDGFHKKVWPGEEGLSFVSDVESSVPWGAIPRTSSDAIRTDRGGSNGGWGDGGGGGGGSFWGSFNLIRRS